MTEKPKVAEEPADEDEDEKWDGAVDDAGWPIGKGVRGEYVDTAAEYESVVILKIKSKLTPEQEAQNIKSAAALTKVRRATRE